MKQLILPFLLIASVNSFAMDLSCEVHNLTPMTEESVEKFNLFNIEDADQLAADLPDQGTLSPFEIVKDQSRASFSNECDNMYDVSFKTQDLNNILNQSKNVIEGQMEYGVMGSETQKSHIICKVK